MLASATRVYRFGVFELNATSRQLFRSGREIRIQEQPRRLLEALLERHGELVTRDELREKLWPTETFVEFDDGLNTAVQKIRQVIGDEARNPRFVETVPRRGYRFIAPVEIDGEPHAAMDAQPKSAPSAAPAAPARRPPWIWVCAASALVGLVVGLLVARPSGSPPPPTLKLTITPPAAVELRPGFRGGSAISPDGRALVFAANRNGNTRLWLRYMDSLDARELPGTEDGLLPFWSPDSRSIGFVAGRKLRTINLAGAPPQDLAAVSRPTRGAWFEDGTILFSPGRGEPLYRVRYTGGQAVPATDPAAGGAYWPAAILGTDQFVYFSDARGAVTLGSLANPRTSRPLFASDGNAVYAPPHAGRPGYLVWMRGGTLVAQVFRAGDGRLVGDPVPLAERVGFADHTRFVDLSASATGVLLYGAGNMVMRRAAWLKRDGSLLENVGEPGWLRAVRLSPDGRRAVIEQGIDRALWVLNFDLHVSTRLTFEQELSGWPAWSPDGAQVAYTAQRSGSRLRIYRRDSRGGVAEQPVSASAFDLYMYDWSRDGRYVAYCEMNPQTKIDVWILPVGDDAKPYPLLHTAFNEDSPQFSADVRWMAYVSDETGRNEVYVAGIPNAAAKWQISTQGGSIPRWSSDGKELFYVAADGHLMSVPITSGGPLLQWSAPRRLFLTSALGASYDVAPGAEKFLVLTPTEDFKPNELTVLMNWQAGSAH
jgi:Tol biopolymer transport system component/DNA-binding winged helix-turn-helix (wHTH) protein